MSFGVIFSRASIFLKNRKSTAKRLGNRDLLAGQLPEGAVRGIGPDHDHRTGAMPK